MRQANVPGTPIGESRRSPNRSRRHVRLIADLGLSLVPALAIETLTGLVLFLFAHGVTPKGSPWAGHAFDLLASANLIWIQDVSFQTDVHVWAGYLTTWTIALKAWASLPTLTGWWPRRFSPNRLTFEKATAWSLLVLAPASYLSGLALGFRLMPFHERTMRDLHLWVSFLLIPPLAWHLLRFLPTGLRVFAVQIQRGLGLRAGARRQPRPDAPLRVTR